jgi:hypothetical protein
LQLCNHRQEGLLVRSKGIGATLREIGQHPIKANPAKAGDAKPWVYRHSNDHDCQAAEDHNVLSRDYLALLFESQIFIGWLFTLQVLFH